MAIKTFDGFVVSLRKPKPIIDLFGEKGENPVDHSWIRAGIDVLRP